ncbi:hypothetical protein C8Q76DRAFT_715004 [Earliella scabrosa]|nr:hypothetical protein C8Q76DRAFT_715004 [Earliella scabrosa]
MATPYDVLGVVSLVLAILTTIPLVRWINGKLPNSRLTYFDEIVSGTETLLLSLEEDEIFSKPETAAYYRQRLRRVCEDAKQPRWSTYQATTTMKQLRGLFSGLSKKLADLCDEALELRAEISTTATDERKRLLAEGSFEQPSEEKYAIPFPRTQCSLAVKVARSFSAILPRVHSATTRSDSNPSCLPEVKGNAEPVLPTIAPHASPHRSIAGAPDASPCKKRHHTDRFIRRSKRFNTTRRYFSPSIAQMEYTKPGVLRNEEFRRALRSRTVDSVSSTATLVSDDASPLPDVGVLGAGADADLHRSLTLSSL